MEFIESFYVRLNAILLKNLLNDIIVYYIIEKKLFENKCVKQ